MKETKMDICPLRDTFALDFSVLESRPVVSTEREPNYCRIAPRERGCLFVQDDTEERTVNLKSAIVMNEAHFPEFVHK